MCDDIERKRICRKCIGDDSLYAAIRKSSKKRICDYCGQERQTVSMKKVIEEIEAGISCEYNECGMEYFDPETGYYTVPVRDTCDLIPCCFDAQTDVLTYIDPENNKGWISRDDYYYGNDVAANFL